MSILHSAEVPTFYFIGVTTGQSSIMRVFPKWAKILGLDAVMKGIDLPPHAPVEDYRKVVSFLKGDPLSRGALVTTHKLDLYKACRDLFDCIDPYAETLEEVSSLSRRDGKFCAHAKDPISSGLALETFTPQKFWARGGEALLLGAGGSSLAMSLHFSRKQSVCGAPKKITIANRSQPRLQSAKKTLDKLRSKIDFRLVHSPSPADNDVLVASLPPSSLIVNATGLGKDAPGSPTTDAVSYPRDSLVWEINYRGDLIFMKQALAQAEAKNLRVEDGWNYFIHGWTQVIAEVFDVRIDSGALEELSRAAKD
jgi:shikimate 5-dehydrogenase